MTLSGVLVIQGDRGCDASMNSFWYDLKKVLNNVIYVYIKKNHTTLELHFIAMRQIIVKVNTYLKILILQTEDVNCGQYNKSCCQN